MSPGPGHYDAKDYLTKASQKSVSISKTIRHETVSKQVSSQPGPGNYIGSESLMGKNAKSFTIGGKGRDLNRNDSPGPGNYNPSDSPTRYSSPSHVISKTMRTNIISAEK